jgi:hypothetical protein
MVQTFTTDGKGRVVGLLRVHTDVFAFKIIFIIYIFYIFQDQAEDLQQQKKDEGSYHSS